YANGPYIQGAETYPPKWQAAATAFRAGLKERAEIGVPYGATDRQVFDFFNTQGPSNGTVIFVHGGYWKAFDASTWSHLAAGAMARGWAVAMPSYDLCPDVRITDITRQIAAAVTRISERTFGKLALVGHSAGGHLVARMTDPLLLGAEVRDRITRIVPISPVADLTPLLQTEMNDTLRLDEAEAAAESPMNMTPPHGVDVTVWVGADERPVFLEQAENFARSWGAKQVVAEGKHHFDVIDPLAEADSELTKALLGS
ncbi:MAG: alpha/beta hydrolase, partial [Alphaproteobacteria bacterium]